MGGKSLLNSRRSISRILSELLIVAVVLVSVVAAWGFLRGQQASLSKVVEIGLQEATLLKTSSGGVLNINIRNTGNMDLTIGSGSISGPGVSMSFDGLNGLLEAGKSKAAIVTISGSISAGDIDRSIGWGSMEFFQRELRFPLFFSRSKEIVLYLGIVGSDL